MRAIKEVIKELRQKHGNKTQVAKKIGISSQLLGQYENGRHKPKVEFFEKWMEVFGEDIRKVQKGINNEANVSHGTINGTHEETSSDIEDLQEMVDTQMIYINKLHAELRKLRKRMKGDKEGGEEVASVSDN